MFIEKTSEVNITEPSADESAEREESPMPENVFAPESDFVPESNFAPEHNAPQTNMIAVGIRAAFITIAAVIFLFGCYISFFPYSAMKMYSALDMKYMSMVNAERYMNRHSDELDLSASPAVVPAPFGKYADALYCAVNNSVYLMNESATVNGYGDDDTLFYAQKAEKYTNLFIGLSGNTDSLYDRVKRIDDYGIYNSPAALHPYVYSYADKLQAEYFKALFISGKRDSMQEIAEIATTYWDQDDWTLIGDHPASPADIRRYFVFLSQLTTYINAELDKLGLSEFIGTNLTANKVPESVILYGNSKPFDLFVYDGTDVDESGNPRGEGAFTYLYENAVSAYGEFADYLKSQDYKFAPKGETPDIAEHLKFTYYAKIFNDYVLAMNNMTAVLSASSRYFDEEYRTNLQNAHSRVWQNNLYVQNVHVKRDGVWTNIGSCLLSDWYTYGWLAAYLEF